MVTNLAEVQVFLIGDAAPEITGEVIGIVNQPEVQCIEFTMKEENGDVYKTIVPVSQIRFIRLFNLEE